MKKPEEQGFVKPEVTAASLHDELTAALNAHPEVSDVFTIDEIHDPNGLTDAERDAMAIRLNDALKRVAK